MTKRDLSAAVAALVASVILVSPELVRHRFNPTVVLWIGSQSQVTPCIERDFANPVELPGWGHDGQTFYLLAREFPDLDAAAPCLGQPRYRARRILLPALAAPFGSGTRLVVGLVAINLASVALLAAGLVRLLAHRLARTEQALLVGLAAGATPASFMSVGLTLADALGYSLAVWGVVKWRGSRTVPAVALFTLACLARETMLIAAASCAVISALDGKYRRAAPLVIPLLAYAAWAQVIAWRLPADSGSAGQLGRPLAWLFQEGILSNTALSGMLVWAGALIAVRRLWSRAPELAVWVGAESISIAFASAMAIGHPLNPPRAAGLAIPAVALALVAVPARASPARRALGSVPAVTRE